MPTGVRPTLTAVTLTNVVLLTMIAPLATDMYVPAFPLVGRDLGASATEVQLTLTTFFVGMALGQLVGGPISDQRGRRHLLLGSLAVLVAASVACALSSSIVPMMAARLVQGFSGGWAMVIARSIVVDLAGGSRLVRALNVVYGVSMLAPVLGPLAGALVLHFSHWRVSFWLLALWGVGMLVSVALTVPDSLPRESRRAGGLRQLRAGAGVVLRSRAFVGHLVVMAFSMGSCFAYVSTSAFVLESMNGLSPTEYALDFAMNSVGLMAATLISARLAERASTRLVIAGGLGATAAAGLLLLAGAAVLGMPLWVSMTGFFVLITAQGFIGANAGALASEAVPGQAGTGSAVLGFAQWCMAGLIAPLAGLGGAGTAVPMATIIVVLTAGSMLALWWAGRSGTAHPHRAAQLVLESS